MVWKKGTPEKFRIAEKDGVLLTKEGPQKYLAGHFILTGPKGEQYSMSKETFSELKTDNGDGTATPLKIPKLAKLADRDGAVLTAWGHTLQYRAKKDYIIRHGKGDYGVVKADIFQETYQSESAPPAMHQGRNELNHLSLTRGLARGLAGMTGDWRGIRSPDKAQTERQAGV